MTKAIAPLAIAIAAIFVAFAASTSVNADHALDPAGTEITGCTNSFTEGASYFLSEDLIVNPGGICLKITKKNVVLDGNGHSLIGDGTGTGIQIEFANNITVKNLTITNFSYGMKVESSALHSLTNIHVDGNAFGGLRISSIVDTTINSSSFDHTSSGSGLAFVSGSNTGNQVLNSSVSSNSTGGLS